MSTTQNNIIVIPNHLVLLSQSFLSNASRGHNGITFISIPEQSSTNFLKKFDAVESAVKMVIPSQALVAHTCNLSSSGGRHWEDCSPGKIFVRLHEQKKLGVAQALGTA
jgi:hypothetical protein